MTTSTLGRALPVEKAAHSEWAWWLLLVVSVSLLWCAAYNRWTTEAWKTPVHYSGDTLAVMANAKAFASGEIFPVVSKYPPSLGAPFVANWNDYPSPAEGIFFWSGILVRFFGMFTGSNLTVLSTHLLSAGSFYFVARVLGGRRELCLAGAVLFSMSRYAFARDLAHIGPSFYWHVPLGLLVVWWCGGASSILESRKKVLFCVAVAVLHGIQDPYFSNIFLQLLVLTSVICLIRREPWSRIMFPLIIAFAVLATCVLMNLDTFYNRLVNGPNLGALARTYSGLETHALKPIDLFLPFPHRFEAIQAWVQKTYISKALVHGEVGSAYLGVVGILAFGALVWVTARAAINRSTSEGIPSHFWLVLWIILYSIVGGGNGILGLFGLILFRAANRYSIVILAVLLLFLVRQLTTLARRWNWPAISTLAVLMIAVGFLDQSPRSPSSAELSIIRKQVLSDKHFVATVEAALLPGAMVFQLPVWPFPETAPVRGMQDYEHFRPYLYSRSLRFSYGDVKGRARERWQTEVVQLGGARLVPILESYGFSAIIINKKAYDAQAAALFSDLAAAGRSEVLAQSPDLVCISLRPSSHPNLPPEFDENWYALEGDVKENWRWSQGNAKLVLYSSQTTQKQAQLSFSLGTLKSRRVEISAGSRQLYGGFVAQDQPPKPIAFTVPLSPGRNEILFRTDLPGELPGSGDPRRLAFTVRNFSIAE